MPHPTLLQRFQGDSGRRLLVQSLAAQWLVGHDASIAEALADASELRELFPGEALISQGDADNDLYFILSGSLRILVNGREVAIRLAGHHVGEMALIDPTLQRTATNVAGEQTLVARIHEPAFTAIADNHPRIWRALGSELARRLKQREKFHHAPNLHPSVFIGSSTEALSIANAMRAAIPLTTATATLWSQGVFGASRFPIEDLEQQLQSSDFAVLVASPDDQLTFRGQDFAAPRDNVIFELGLFMGALTRHRTFILTPDQTKLKIPTDLLGITQLRYSTNLNDPAGAVAGAAVDVVARINSLGSR